MTGVNSRRVEDLTRIGIAQSHSGVRKCKECAKIGDLEDTTVKNSNLRVRICNRHQLAELPIPKTQLGGGLGDPSHQEASQDGVASKRSVRNGKELDYNHSWWRNR